MDRETTGFYGRLARLLGHIEASEIEDLVPDLLRELVASFGEDLGIINGRLYEEEDGAFRLVLDVGSKEGELEGLALPKNYRGISLLLAHGLYIFDRDVKGLDQTLETRLGGPRSAAMILRTRPRQLLAFGLSAGAPRDQLAFWLRAIQKTLHNRLLWDKLNFDMNQAREIHQSLLPRAMPHFPGFDIAAVSLPAEIVGGDFYDFYPLGPDLLGLAIGDATGHGLPAALQVRDVVIGLRMGTELQLKMVPMLQKLNRIISRSTISSRFISLFYAELESNGNFVYVNAGHPPPLLIMPESTRSLGIGGPILGPMPDMPFKRGFIHVDRGSVLVLYTDGITESAGPRHHEFSESGILEHVKPKDPRSARKILDELLLAASEWSPNGVFSDDASLVIIKRLP